MNRRQALAALAPVPVLAAADKPPAKLAAKDFLFPGAAMVLLHGTENPADVRRQVEEAKGDCFFTQVAKDAHYDVTEWYEKKMWPDRPEGWINLPGTAMAAHKKDYAFSELDGSRSAEQKPRKVGLKVLTHHTKEVSVTVVISSTEAEKGERYITVSFLRHEV